MEFNLKAELSGSCYRAQGMLKSYVHTITSVRKCDVAACIRIHSRVPNVRTGLGAAPKAQERRYLPAARPLLQPPNSATQNNCTFSVSYAFRNRSPEILTASGAVICTPVSSAVADEACPSPRITAQPRPAVTTLEVPVSPRKSRV